MANTFKSAATGSNTALTTMYTCPTSTTSIVHAIYLSNIDGTNAATINLSVSGSATFEGRTYLLKTVNIPADSTVIIEKPINLGAGDKLETEASANGDIDAFASVLEIT